MSGDRRVFEEAMQAGAAAAWNQEWDRAIASYRQALAEFPTDVTAFTGLGLAYVGAGQHEAALESYTQASELAPDDPVLYEHIGRVREQLGRGREAAEAYLEAAERYIGQRQAPHLALERWRDAVRVFPDSIEAHARLLRYYQRQGQVSDAMNECLVLARIYQSQSHTERAVQVCDYALKLAPHDPDVLAVLDELRFGAQATGEVEAGVSREDLEPLAAIQEAEGATVLDLPIASAADLGEEQGSPVDVTRQRALSDLAESFFEEESVASSEAAARLSKPEVDILIGRAVDFQARGRVDEAIGAYERVVRVGMEWPAVHFNLGLLYQKKARFDAAVSQFERALSDADYALGSHFALGECNRALGRIDEALNHFVDMLEIVDLATVSPERADALRQRYVGLVGNILADGGREQASEFINSVVEFLGEKGWESRVMQARHRLDALAEEGTTLSLAEMLALPDSERVLESVAMAQDYARRGVPYAALEEIYHALGLAPTYLPIHRQMAQVLVGMGNVEDAVSKYLVIADTYRMRGDIRPAMAMHRQALDLVPMNTGVRARFIELLIHYGEIDDALEHYLILADSYEHLAQIDQAREIYQEALRLAPRGSSDRQWEVQILHRLGDIYLQRVDWKHAIGVYERIRKLAPDDERARSALMDLYNRVKRPDLAIAELDQLLKIYRESDRPQRILSLLDNAVREWPDSLPLRTRLAQAHLDAGNVEQALQHLDKLGDLQLEAGRYEDARATVRAIIALRPPNVADYQQLLDQLSERDSG